MVGLIVNAAPPPSGLIIRCARRWRAIVSARGTEIPGELETVVRLIRAHRAGCSVNWESLAEASDFDIEHDVGAMVTHYNPAAAEPGGLLQPIHRSRDNDASQV